jgi:hypothetical protein
MSLRELSGAYCKVYKPSCSIPLFSFLYRVRAGTNSGTKNPKGTWSMSMVLWCPSIALKQDSMGIMCVLEVVWWTGVWDMVMMASIARSCVSIRCWMQCQKDCIDYLPEKMGYINPLPLALSCSSFLYRIWKSIMGGNKKTTPKQYVVCSALAAHLSKSIQILVMRSYMNELGLERW